jgi:hypothetical protein
MGTVALGLGWLTAPLSTSFLALVGTLATVIGTVAVLASAHAARRGLYVSTVAVSRTRNVPLNGEPREPRKGTDPHEMKIRFTLRGGTAVEEKDFHQGNPLVFDVGAGITRVLECRTKPENEPKPLLEVEGNSLLMGPALINQWTDVYVSLLTTRAPRGPVECTDAVLTNVRVRSVEEAETKRRAYLASLPGAAAIMVTFGLQQAVPGLADSVSYKLVAIVTFAIAFLVIVVAKATRSGLAAVLSVTVLLGLTFSVARGAASLGGVTSGPPVAAAPSTAAAHHRCPAVGGGNWRTTFQAAPNDNETVGYSSSEYAFANQTFSGEDKAQRTQDQRVHRDEQLIIENNARADCAYQRDHAQGGDRPVVELAYFAGLTEGVDEDYDSGEAEELEGLAAAQMVALPGSGPLLKIVVADGGSKMQDAVQVAGKLISLAREDHRLLGIVGMDRSVSQVKAAIQLFATNHVPVVATTLSADGIGQGSSPYYYQLTPSNSSEAALIRQYIQQVVHAYFEQVAAKYPSGGSPVATKIVIEEPNQSPHDLYIHTLVRDLTTEKWRAFGLPQPQLIYTPGPALCGDSVVDIYAGRHDKPVTGVPYDNDFSGFLSYIAESCKGPQPFIIADDGVTRFVADPAARVNSTSYDLTISYVTKGIAILRSGTACLHEQTAKNYSGGRFGVLCRTYASIVATLRADVKGLNFLWTGERVGLAYDAANLFLTAVGRGGPLTRAQIPRQFRLDGEVQGVTGSEDFAVSDIGDDSGMPMAIVRLDLGTTAATPACAFPGQDGYVYGPGPGPGDCPNNQG